MTATSATRRSAPNLDRHGLLRQSLVGARLMDYLFRRLILFNAALAIGVIVLIFVYVGKESLPLLLSEDIQQEVTVGKMFSSQPNETEELALSYIWQPVSKEPKYSVIPLLLGSLKVTFIALLFAAPLSIAAAIYTAEFAVPWVRELVKPIIELLAGIPSVVLGFLALVVLASWLQHFFQFDYRLNAVNAGLAMGLAIIPIIYTVSEDALSSVPRSYREASLALGVSPWKTARSVVLPAATPGIFAAMVLGFGRAVGETMIVLMASGNAAVTSLSLADSVRTVSATIAAELGEVVFGSAHYHVLFFLGTMLFILTFLLNMVGDVFVSRLKQRMMGAS